MAPSSITFDSLLALDIGETTTRAILFDVVDGVYRFIAAGSAVTTMGLPFRNVGEGVHMALAHLSELTGRVFVGHDERLIIPAHADGSGVDALVVVLSGGPPVKVIVAGLLEDVSVESASRLAQTTYTQIVDTFSLNDHRKTEARLDAILRLQPDLVLIAGGTEGGAGQSVARVIEPVQLACNLLPETMRPHILYVGNQALGEKITGILAPLTAVELAPNVRPSIEAEQVEPAHTQLARQVGKIQARKLAGVHELDDWSGGGLTPRATAFGRVVRFLSLDDPVKGVLGLDVGAGSTALAAATGGKLTLGVYPELGLARAAEELHRTKKLPELMRWLPVDIPPGDVSDYLYNKTINPAALPQTAEELAIEQALARVVIRSALLRSPLGTTNGRAAPLLPPFEPLIAAGSVLTHAPTLGQTMMMLLDAVQPTGITTVILDRNNLTAALGAASTVNSTLAVQVLDSGTYVNLGTVISPVSSTRTGMPVLRVQLKYKDSEEEIKVDVKQGSLEVLPLASGQVASLYLKPFHRADIGMGAGRGGSLKRVVGGALGVIIDARGRPLQLTNDTARRQELLRKWLWTLGG